MTTQLCHLKTPQHGLQFSTVKKLSTSADFETALFGIEPVPYGWATYTNCYLATYLPNGQLTPIGGYTVESLNLNDWDYLIIQHVQVANNAIYLRGEFRCTIDEFKAAGTITHSVDGTTYTRVIVVYDSDTQISIYRDSSFPGIVRLMRKK